MPEYRYLEVLSRGPVSRVRLFDHRTFLSEEVAELVNEWNLVADSAECRTLFVDCSNVRTLSSEVLGKLVLLHRRLKQKQAVLVLCGLRSEVRQILNSTKLDRLLMIVEDEGQAVAALA